MTDDSQINASLRASSKEKSSKGIGNKERAEAKKESRAVLKKIDVETCKLLSQLRDRANKKEYGRKIRDGELIRLGLTLVDSTHIQVLQESSYSESDRLKIAHAEYQKIHGKLTLDQFIGKLLKCEIRKESAE